MKISSDIAEQFAFEYDLDESEVRSVCLLAACERRKHVEVQLTENPGVVAVFLQRAARRHFQRERMNRLEESDQYFYDPGYVRLFLPHFFAVEDWAYGPINDDTVAEYPTTEAIDTAIDIKGAWSGLKDWEAEIILARHVTCPPATDGTVDWDRIAQETGRDTGRSARAGYARATRRLTYRMNGHRARRLADHEGPGARRTISNAHARTLIARAQ